MAIPRLIDRQAAHWVETVRVLRYGLVGASNFVVDFVTLALLLWLFSPESTPGLVAANSTAFLLATYNSFILNSRLTFGVARPFVSRWFAIFVLINLISLAVSNLSLLFFIWSVESLGIAEGRLAVLLAKPPSVLVLASYGYLSYRKLFLGAGAGSLLAMLGGVIRRLLGQLEYEGRRDHRQAEPVPLADD
jgi:putative flippase GtrA